MARLRKQVFSRAILPLAAAVLPAVLLYGALRTFRELDEQRAVFLRHRVSLIAARLEHTNAADLLLEGDPYLVDVQVISQRSEADSPEFQELWEGRALFRTEYVKTADGDAPIFRTHIPFHSDGRLQMARIDIDSSAADFLVVHARHNIYIAVAAGLVLISLSVYSLWATRRNARLQVRQMELEHLAHIGEMSAVLAHEIRNPLGTVKGFVQLAGEQADAATRRLLDPAVSEMERLENLVKDLLAYGRPAAPQWRVVEWRTVAATAEQHARHLIGRRPIRVSMGEAEFAWRSDPDLIEQALLNLLRNAIEAVPLDRPGEIRVTAELRTGSGPVIRIADNGSGLDGAVRERLFEPFLTTKASGTGLGLAITRRIVNSLEGELEVRPGVECGVEATIRFPAAPANGGSA